MSGRRIIWSSMGWAVFVSALFIMFWLSSGVQETAFVWLPMIAGVWVGLFLAWGAFRLFGWGRSAARDIYVRALIVGLASVALYFGGPLFVVNVGVNSSMSDLLPLAGDIAYFTVGGVVLGAANAATDIARRLRKEEERSS
jgi:hypothetical protein